ncbi:hypothetical protein M3Y98_00233200 [Aphelenchoides besseyi]|nr:hypothetical protein M3Y98_00233200 [Aphelenchoides besseyi]
MNTPINARSSLVIQRAVDRVEMVAYKLKYFDLRGRAEPLRSKAMNYVNCCRLIFHYANVPFEDVRIQREDWPAEKPNTPYGQIPVLEINGRPLAQTFALCRYLGAKFGLAGKDDEERANLDEIMELYREMTDQFSQYFRVMLGFSQGDKDQLRRDQFLPAIEKYMPFLEKKLNESGSGFFAKSGPSYVDLFISESVHTLSQPQHEQKVFEEKAAFLIEHSKRVHELPQLKEYLSKRKQTPI